MHKRAKTALVLFMALFSSAIAAQQLNPHKLPPCPKPDQSKKTDMERFSKWTGCWGKYEVLFDEPKGTVIEGEWNNGRPRPTGRVRVTLPDGLGEYVGQFIGRGTLTRGNGDRYVGEFESLKLNGHGT